MIESDIDQRSTILVFSGPTMAEAAGGAVEHIVSSLQAPFLLLPSSLDRRDALVHALKCGLRDRGRPSSVAVPAHPLRLLTGMFAAKRSEWRAADLSLPDGPDREVLLPIRLLAENAVLYVTHVNVVARTGPFQLDLLSRYAHSRHRIRQVVDPDRAGLAAETNLAMLPGWCVVGCDVPPGVIAITRDLIAGELFALCLAERFFDRHTEFSSPWEDRVVQRATELELGARTPGDIRIEIAGEDARSSEETRTRHSVHDIVAAVQERIGIATRIEAGSSCDPWPR